MLRLKGGTHYLVLKRTGPCSGHVVSFHSRFEEALAGWSAGARVSPVFATDRGRAPQLTGRRRSWLLFLGPVDPGRVQLSGPSVFLTFGLYNILMVSRSEGDRRRALSHVAGLSVPWE